MTARPQLPRRARLVAATLLAFIIAAGVACGVDDTSPAPPVTTSSSVPSTESEPVPTVSSTRATTPAVTSGGAGSAPDPTMISTTRATVPRRDCVPAAPDRIRLTETDPVAGALELSALLYTCAVEVGLAPISDPRAAATLVAAGLDGPLLLVGESFESRLVAELGRLAPERVLAAGFAAGVPAAALPDFEVLDIEVEGNPSPPDGSERFDRLWLVAAAGPVAPLQAAAARLGVDVQVVGPDSASLPEATRAKIARAGQVELVSPFNAETTWHLDVIRRGHRIPGGGLILFDDESPRRLVALYGHPTTGALGVLGEQDPAGGIELLGELAAPYGADGATVLPTFEIIATVASVGPGRDGDYSAETSRDVLRPWIEAAGANGVYVVLDLQPGRTDFLTQAKIYEEFLRRPHVGLALDPEWRLGPNQVHLRQIGTVDAAEVNEVIHWLAGIVREEALPQKLLIVHQFKLSMITNRDRIESTPELAIVIQMDGQGGLASKYRTWEVVTEGTEESPLRWGWKNFYDEDSPMATPEQVLELTPTTVFVSFQ